MNSFNVLWEIALKKLEDFYIQNNNSVAFETYIRLLSPEFEKDGCYYFKVGNDYFKEQVIQRFASQIQSALEEAYMESYGIDKEIEICVVTAEELDQLLISDVHKQQPRRISLNPNYTFDTFVVGNSNNLAHAASRAVAASPGVAYNPLFIYGGVGLGKTHLMHAIGNSILEKNPSAEIIYITSEAFTNELIEAIRKKSNGDDSRNRFRNKFRKADVLLIDDIQFISKSAGTQEEVFHTFNTLYEANKQIILSSDKPPSEIPKLEERLLSRFQWGLLTDIGLPDYETRVAILKNKAAFIKEQTKCRLPIDDDVMNYIASKEDTNIRDLEGALKKVIACAQLESNITSIDLSLASRALKSFFSEPIVRAVTPKLVIKKVCEYYDISEEDLLSKKKNREIAFPRQIAMFLLKKLTDLTNKKIGESVGLEDHSTVIYACKKIENMVSKDSEIQNTVNDIIQKIKE